MIVTSTYFKKQFDVSKAELIGEGNFAQVYRVYDPDHGDSLAVRRVDRSMGQSEDIQKEKVINQELRRVQNENILKIYDIVETNKCVWYITEFCEGGSLWDALNDCKDNRMNQRDALAVIQQVSKGVRELHNHRITHRDLKPENILLKTKYIPKKPIPEIKIADFGLSTKKIIMETIAGTKEYIAPEQARFHNYTNAVDVWSLGIIFDQILHGNPFYIGDNNKEVFQKILKIPYKVRDQNLRPSIKNFLISILKKKPYQRPIIAAICQTIETIINEVDSNSQVKTDKLQKPSRIQKKVNFHEQKSKSPRNMDSKQSHIRHQRKMSSNTNTPGLESQVKEEEQSQPPPQQIAPNSANKKIQRKQTIERNDRNQFKRTNPHNQVKKKESLHNDGLSPSNIGRISSKKDVQANLGSTTSPGSQSNDTTIMGEKEKINVYRVEKKKNVQIVNPPKSSEISSVPLSIKEYSQKIMELKNQLQQSQLTIENDRQFILNMNLSMNELPQRFNSDEILKKFRQDYDCLNYMSTTVEYETKLMKGKNELQNRKKKTQKQMDNYREKMKEAFLKQVDSYVDLYIDKVLK